ncbi:unnamed protein product [Larinioides sclopetarius]|uniref:Uncharacterized protein n=1 Tax=Larinioides sclopetarius TaxID=280406 RepID=A0AAV1ZB11_9ARAC
MGGNTGYVEYQTEWEEILATSNTKLNGRKYWLRHPKRSELTWMLARAVSDSTSFVISCYSIFELEARRKATRPHFPRNNNPSQD